MISCIVLPVLFDNMLSHGTGVCVAARNLDDAEAVIMINHILMKINLSELGRSDNIPGPLGTRSFTGNVW